MHVAIYARRSKEEHQAESIDTQLENARRFILDRGWGLAGERVFIDSDHSRAEFKNRPRAQRAPRGNQSARDRHSRASRRIAAWRRYDLCRSDNPDVGGLRVSRAPLRDRR